MHYYLYEIKNNINGKIYIGVHKTKSIDDGYMGSGKVILNAIEKNGIKNFTKTILETFDSEEQMYLREKEIVNDDFLKRKDVYNLRRGGSGGFDFINSKGLNDRTGKSFTEEQKKNISIGRKKVVTEEYRKNQSQKMMGNKIGIGNKGGYKPKTPEHKEKIRQSVLKRIAEKRVE